MAHLLNRVLSSRLRAVLRQLAVVAIPSMRHLDMPRRLRHMATLGFDPRTIFDVGAATGEWARLAAGVWPGARVIGFEPTTEAEPGLRRTAAELPNFSYRRCFLGPERKRLRFTAAGDGTTALAAQPAPEDATADSAAQAVQAADLAVDEAEMLVMDELVASGEVPQPDFIKLDVQGFELEVLRGAGRALAGCQGVLAEVNLMRFAPGMPTADEVIDFLREHGFAWYDVAGVLRRPLDDALGQMDLIFLRKDHPLRASATWG